MKTSGIQETPVFKPITLTITLETEDEAQSFKSFLGGQSTSRIVSTFNNAVERPLADPELAYEATTQLYDSLDGIYKE